MSDVIKLNARSKKVNLKLKDLSQINISAPDSDEDYFQSQIDKSYEKGLKDGKDEAEKNLELEYSKKLSENIEFLNKVTGQLDQKMLTYENEFENLLVEMSFIIAERIIYREIENKSSITEILKDSLKKIQGANSLVIKLNPEDMNTVKGQAKEIFNADLFAKVKFEETSNIEKGGCLLETEFGNINARISSQLTELKKELDKDFRMVKM